MKFIRMVLVNCKKYIRDYANIVMMFVVPIVCVGMVNVLAGKGSSGLDIKAAIVNLDKGDLGNKLIENLDVNSIYSDKDKALEDLKKYESIAVYEIPENFTENINKGTKPIVNSYKIEEGNSTLIFESKLEKDINNLMKIKLFKDNNVINEESELDKNIVNVEYNMHKGLLSTESFMPIVLIIFFLVTFSANITVDLLRLRKQRILERFLTTNNRGYEIMGSIYISMWLVQIIFYTASFVVLNTIFKYNFENFGILLLNISLMSLVSISLGIMISRLFKNEGVASLVVYLTSLLMFFVYINTIESGGKSEGIMATLAKFTPFYWSLGSIEKSVLFPNVFILLLFALIFFSAGSIKYSNFAKKIN